MKIYNSLTRTKVEFVPVKKGKIGMYICGPTVYDEPHIGHARSAYIFDVIRRYLIDRSYKVNFVRNVTDVDDKIIEKARKEGLRVKGPASALRASAGTPEDFLNLNFINLILNSIILFYHSLFISQSVNRFQFCSRPCRKIS